MGTNFSPNGKNTGRGTVPFAGGNSVGSDWLVVIKNIELLGGQIDFNPAIGIGIVRSNGGITQHRGDINGILIGKPEWPKRSANEATKKKDRN